MPAVLSRSSEVLHRFRESKAMSEKIGEEVQVFEEVAKWGDDPEGFLAAMQKEYPPLVNILTTKQVKLLAKSPKDPYPAGETDVNEEFMSDLTAYFVTHIIAMESKKGLRNSLVDPVTSDKSIMVEETNVPISVANKVS